MPYLDSGGVANVATAIVFVVLDTLAVFLRILSKSKTKYYFSSDDQWILAALAFFYAWVGQIIYDCFPFARFVFTYELTNALIDVAILALPMYMVRKLQMRTRQKIQVMSIFAMGGL
ncbi:MAG: hypothetical protein Q9205_002565 [Flavoplaca limonia]